MKQSERIGMRLGFCLLNELKAASVEDGISVAEAVRRVLVAWSAHRIMSRGTVGSIIPTPGAKSND